MMRPDAGTGFVYQRLRNTDSFRLLQICVSASIDDPLRCVVKEFQRNRAPAYKAISYTWGEIPSARGLRCSIVERDPSSPEAKGNLLDLTGPEWMLQVTSNCEETLRLLRSHNETGWLWIDHVCIDQNNVQECSAQVSEMALTYSNANEVIACLVDENDASYNREVERSVEMRLSCSRSIGEFIARLLRFRWLVASAAIKSSEVEPIIRRVERIEKRFAVDLRRLQHALSDGTAERAFHSFKRVHKDLFQALECVEQPHGYTLSAERQELITTLFDYWHLDNTGMILPFDSIVTRDLTPLESDLVRDLLAYAQDISGPEGRFMDDIGSQRWFKRLWVVQEVGLSRCLVLLRKNIRMNWTEIRRHLIRRGRPPYLMELQEARVRNHDEIEVHIQDHPANAYALYAGPWRNIVRVARRDIDLPDLPAIMAATRTFGCSDPRDRLFAVLPLFARPYPPLLAPDYSKTVAQVYIDLSTYFVEQGKSEILSSACRAPSSDPGIPTWVADWRMEVPPKASRITRDLFKPPGRNIEQPATARVCGKSLFASGIIIGEVTASTRLHGLRDSDTASEEAVEQIQILLANDASSTDALHDSIAQMLVTASKQCDTIQLLKIGGSSFGLTSREMRAGDLVCYLLDHPHPFVLRRQQKYWQLLDECHLVPHTALEAIGDFSWPETECQESGDSLHEFEIH